VPKDRETLDPEKNWILRNQPLITLYIRVNTLFKRRKDKKVKKEDKKKELIYIDEVDEVEREKQVFKG